MLLNINYFFFILLPFLIVFSQFLADFSISFMALSFIFFLIYEKNYEYFKNPIFIILILWWLYICFCSAISLNPLHSFESSLFYVRFIFFAFSISFFLKNNNKLIDYFTYSLFLIFLLLIIDSFMQFYFGANLLGYFMPDPSLFGTRVSSFFGDEYILGSFISRLLPLLLGLIIYLKFSNKIKFYIIVIFIPLLEYIVLISGERAALFFILIFNLCFFIYSRKLLSILITKTCISFLGMIFLLVFSEQLNKRIISHTLYQYNDLKIHNNLINEKKINLELNYIKKNNSNNSYDISKLTEIDQYKELIFFYIEKIPFFSVQHLLIYSTSYKIFQDNNIFFGIGPKMYRKLCKQDKYKTISPVDKSKDGCQSHPHNTYVQLLTETGIFGFIFIFSIFILITYQIFLKNLYLKFKGTTSLNDTNISLYFCLFITLWPLIPGGNFFHNWLNIIFFLPLGFLLYFKNIKENEINF